MASRFVFTPESAHFPITGYAAMRRVSTNGRTSIAYNDSSNTTAYWTAIAPENYASNAGNVSLSIKYFMTSAVSGVVLLSAALESNTTTDNVLSAASSFGAEGRQTQSISGALGLLKETVIPVPHDGLTAGNYFRIKIDRLAGSATDTATGDFNVVAVEMKDGV